MRVGVGLPSGVPGVNPQMIFEWAHKADAGPFSSLGVIDRLVYDAYDSLTTLAAIAPVTRRVKLATTIVIGPLQNNALLAKKAATLDAISHGRLVLGLAIGARKEDYEAAGIDYRSRGRRLTEQLSLLRTIWEESHIGPAPASPHGPALLVGGLSDSTYARVARYTDGYVHGGGPPRAFARAADKACSAWLDARRPGKPQLWAQGYFTLGDETTVDAGYQYMRNYYAFTGPFAERIAAGLLTTPQAIAQFIRGYEEAGCDELILFPAVAEVAQIDRLADVLLGLGRTAS